MLCWLPIPRGEVLAYAPVSHAYMPPQHQIVDDLPKPSLHLDLSDPLDRIVTI